MKLQRTYISYTPTALHNIKSWNAIVKCFDERGPVVSQLVLVGLIKNHPTPTTNKSTNAEEHIKWHVRCGRLQEATK